MTKAEARAALSARRDCDLARLLHLTATRLYMFKDDEPLAEPIVWRVRALVAERKLEALKSEQKSEALK